MKIYLVGGAVRDSLLGLPVKERDWVVVGAASDDMLAAGYHRVGKDFPVFLHPKTNEEYALARTERKVAKGYTGFEFDVSPQVTLEEDLKRRDLTINAMAQTPEGVIVDPYHGREDLAKKIFRHVSAAFSEDPVRILRVARFSARFAFDIAPETLKLMCSMVAQGEVDSLVAERVWKELERALKEPYPENFFAVLTACDALTVLFPQLIFSEAELTALRQAVILSDDPQIRFAALLHTLSEFEIQALSDRYRVTHQYRELAILVSKYLPHYQTAKTLTAEELLDLLLSTDAFRRPARFKKFLLACEACSSDIFSTHLLSEWLLSCYHTAQNTDITSLTSLFAGQAIAQQIKEQRRMVLRKWLNTTAK